MNEITKTWRLTEFSKGAGCGCKISPKALEEILAGMATPADGKLLVGNDSRDDAAVYDLGNGTALISTTDFFTPVVDDATAFGQVAAANAISDVYAMGGKPVMALAIMGWPEKIPASEARKVMTGAREICRQAGVALSGGHSIELQDPIFGLAVTGLVAIGNLKRNNTARAGDAIFLSKPLGVGILSTAQKRKIIDEADAGFLVEQLTRLNTPGETLGQMTAVTAMTDVTGFGLSGHLIEMAEGSGLSAILSYKDIPVYHQAKHYLKQRSIPDATYRNWQSHGDKIRFGDEVDVMEAFSILPDPQTNGGLLIAVDGSSVEEVAEVFRKNGLSDYAKPIGHFIAKEERVLTVK